MSKLSEQRENEQVPVRTSGPSWKWIVIVAGVLLAAWVGYDYYSSSQKISTLDSFAKCVSSKGLRMYGAWWCPHCAEQKELFGYAFQHVNYTECGIEGQTHSVNEQCKKEGVKNFPTWQFSDGSRHEGTLTLSALADKSGCKLP
jgi:hypothetical protein